MLKENIKRSLKNINCTFAAMHSRYLIEDFSEEDTEDELVLDLETADTEVLSDVELPLDSESETETETASETESVSESST